ncbi:MAG: hypothetical protein SFZ02_18425 [bacterium]|nr:hypothetical protein [bacterium]
MMKLPYHENAMVHSSKVTEYLLNLDHKDGKSKATFFLMMGFSLDKWEILRDILLAHAQYDVTDTLQTTRGIHYVIEGSIETPIGKSPNIRTVWALEYESTIPRLITAYPLK